MKWLAVVDVLQRSIPKTAPVGNQILSRLRERIGDETWIDQVRTEFEKDAGVKGGMVLIAPSISR